MSTNITGKLSHAFSYLIILASIVMLVWGLLGFLEYFTGQAPVLPLQNATFPAGTQFVHWTLITLSGGMYLVGFVTRWRYTPIAMAVLFGSLATMCSIQTFDFMENDSRYTDFARECFYYLIISIYLFRSKRMQNHFGKLMVAVGSSSSSAPLTN